MVLLNNLNRCVCCIAPHCFEWGGQSNKSTCLHSVDQAVYCLCLFTPKAEKGDTSDCEGNNWQINSRNFKMYLSSCVFVSCDGSAYSHFICQWCVCVCSVCVCVCAARNQFSVSLLVPLLNRSIIFLFHNI